MPWVLGDIDCRRNSAAGAEPPAGVAAVNKLPQGVLLVDDPPAERWAADTHLRRRCKPGRLTIADCKSLKIREKMVDAVGIEPTTSRLRVECSTN